MCDPNTVQLGCSPVFQVTGVKFLRLCSGLKRCVEYLLAHGADPCAENKSGLTPCDLAAVKNHHEVALLLESRMVSSVTPEENATSVRRVSTFEGVLSEGLDGLRAQDLLV